MSADVDHDLEDSVRTVLGRFDSLEHRTRSFLKEIRVVEVRGTPLIATFEAPIHTAAGCVA
jgi:hypothetical protein